MRRENGAKEIVEDTIDINFLKARKNVNPRVYKHNKPFHACLITFYHGSFGFYTILTSTFSPSHKFMDLKTLNSVIIDALHS